MLTTIWHLLWDVIFCFIFLASGSQFISLCWPTWVTRTGFILQESFVKRFELFLLHEIFNLIIFSFLVTWTSLHSKNWQLMAHKGLLKFLKKLPDPWKVLENEKCHSLGFFLDKPWIFTSTESSQQVVWMCVSLWICCLTFTHMLLLWLA